MSPAHLLKPYTVGARVGARVGGRLPRNNPLSIVGPPAPTPSGKCASKTERRSIQDLLHRELSILLPGQFPAEHAGRPLAGGMRNIELGLTEVRGKEEGTFRPTTKRRALFLGGQNVPG